MSEQTVYIPMNKPVYSILGTDVAQALRHPDLNNQVFHNRIEYMVLNHLPHGSGFDVNPSIDWDATEPNKIVINGSFHAMDEWGGYLTWIDYTIILEPVAWSDYSIECIIDPKLLQQIDKHETELNELSELYQRAEYVMYDNDDDYDKITNQIDQTDDDILELYHIQTVLYGLDDYILETYSICLDEVPNPSNRQTSLSIELVKPNFTIVRVNGSKFWFSYQTIVAFHHRGSLTICENIWSVTTGKHLNWIDGDHSIRLTYDEFQTRLNDALSDL